MGVINMTNKEMVVEVLTKYGAMTSKQLAVQLNVKKGVIMTPAQVAGVLRPLVISGHAATSKDSYGKTVYWITDYGKECLKNG
jgi:hypothetical protein